MPYIISDWLILCLYFGEQFFVASARLTWYINQIRTRFSDLPIQFFKRLCFFSSFHKKGNFGVPEPFLREPPGGLPLVLDDGVGVVQRQQLTDYLLPHGWKKDLKKKSQEAKKTYLTAYIWGQSIIFHLWFACFCYF